MIEALDAALIRPFAEFAFMQRALIGALLLALSACPVGVFLMLRGMSLAGDAMAHAILPGAAVGFLLYGLEILPMTVGGLIAGAAVALGAGAVSRLTIQKEDASMAAFYLISLALGVCVISLRGSSVDLTNVLFGAVLALNDEALTLIAGICGVTLLALAIFWRALAADSLDPLFLRSVSKIGAPAHFLFLGLAVLNMVGGFQALGTLLSVGLMMLPAAAARFWASRLFPMTAMAVGIGMVSAYAGLLLSYHWGLPSGPTIVLSAGAIYLVSLFAAPRGLIATHLRARSHRAA